MANSGRNWIRGTSGLYNSVRIRDIGKQAEGRKLRPSGTDGHGELDLSDLLFVAGGRMASSCKITYAGGAPSDCG